MLTRTCLGDDAGFAHASCEQGLPHGIVDLVCAGVQKIFPFEINLRTARMRGQPLGVKQRRWAATVIAQQLVKFVPEVRIVARARELFR